MNNTTIKKTVIGMILGFAISQVLITLFFTSYNGVQPQSVGYLQRSFTSFVATMRDSFKQSPDKRSQEERTQAITDTKNMPSRIIAPGVYAAEDEGHTASYTQFLYQNVQWVTSSLTLPDGKKVTVRYPAGQQPPTPATFQD